MRQLNLFDQLVCGFDALVRAVCVPEHRSTIRDNPACAFPDIVMNEKDKQHTAGLMRVNHSGEVCAQALYQGQALTAHLTTTKEQMLLAASEEIDHLAWCEERLQELGSQPSILNIFWYTGSLTMGAVAGLMGDRWSLGFVAETERQVSLHLEKHLQKILTHDVKTREILAKMQSDEEQHRGAAMAAGAFELPFVIKQLMKMASLLMTKSSYYI